jgi:hypothetical protein
MQAGRPQGRDRPTSYTCPFSKLHPQQKSWSLIFAAVALFHPVRIYMDWASHDRRLVGTDVGELDRPRRRWWPRFFRAETRRARCTLKRVGPPQFGGLVVFVILSRGLEFATIPVAKTFSWCSPSGSSCMTSRSWEMTEPDKKGRSAP